MTSIRPIMMSEIRRMRALRAEGMSYLAIGSALGRSPESVRNHASDVPFPPRRSLRFKQEVMRRVAIRQQKIIDACNRLLASEAVRP